MTYGDKGFFFIFFQSQEFVGNYVGDTHTIIPNENHHLLRLFRFASTTKSIHHICQAGTNEFALILS
jgi:hypothetical protein